jgi:acyl-CoA synthetase (AMP-forming)/AMP-acid ligase II
VIDEQMSPLRLGADIPLTLGAQIEARAAHDSLTDRVFAEQGDRSWTWGRYRDECVRFAHFLLQTPGFEAGRSAHVAMLLENHLEVLSILGGCAYAGATLFGLNTGLQGGALARVLQMSQVGVLVVTTGPSVAYRPSWRASGESTRQTCSWCLRRAPNCLLARPRSAGRSTPS